MRRAGGGDGDMDHRALKRDCFEPHNKLEAPDARLRFRHAAVLPALIPER